MNKFQWSRRILITFFAIGSGTAFLYIKENIHDIKATNYEGRFEKFDHPFALLFCVYIGQLVIFSCACLLNGPIRNQLLLEICQTRSAISKVLCRQAMEVQQQRLLGNRDDDEGQNLQNGEPPAPANALEIQNGIHDPDIIIVQARPATDIPEAEDHESFIALFTNGDQALRLWNYLPPAIMMLLSTSFVYYAFGATYPATIVMFRAVSLAAAGIFRCQCMCNVFRIQKSFTIHQWLAVLIMMAAVAHSAYHDLITSKKTEERNDISYLVTIPLLTVAHVGIALADTYDEKFLHEKRGVPLIMCFVEATLGTIVYLIILPIMYYIPDPLYPTTQDGILENALNAFVQMTNNPKIVAFVIGLTLSETIWMAARAFITRHANAVVKTIIDSLQLVFVRYVTPELYVCSEESEATTVFTVVVFGLGIAVFYFSERRRQGQL